MDKYATSIKAWLGYAAVITLACGIIYITEQQNFRLSANDPQVQMAHDGAMAIDKAADPKTLAGTTTAIELSQDLSPYVVVYDTLGKAVAGTATLNGKPLKIPQGVINFIRKNGKDAASWQPEPGVRQAMVGFSTAKKDYIVVAGRSLAPVEERIGLLGEQVVFGWLMSLIGLLLVVFVQSLITKKAAAA
jgi:hypothetical protein